MPVDCKIARYRPFIALTGISASITVVKLVFRLLFRTLEGGLVPSQTAISGPDSPLGAKEFEPAARTTYQIRSRWTPMHEHFTRIVKSQKRPVRGPGAWCALITSLKLKCTPNNHRDRRTKVVPT